MLNLLSIILHRFIDPPPLLTYIDTILPSSPFFSIHVHWFLYPPSLTLISPFPLFLKIHWFLPPSINNTVTLSHHSCYPGSLPEGGSAFSALDVPHFECFVIGATHYLVIIYLKTSNVKMLYQKTRHGSSEKTVQINKHIYIIWLREERHHYYLDEN